MRLDPSTHRPLCFETPPSSTSSRHPAQRAQRVPGYVVPQGRIHKAWPRCAAQPGPRLDHHPDHAPGRGGGAGGGGHRRSAALAPSAHTAHPHAPRPARPLSLSLHGCARIELQVLALFLEGAQLRLLAARDLPAEDSRALDHELGGGGSDALRQAVGVAQHRVLGQVAREYVRHARELRRRAT
eukprot:scaffold48897_cov59-Phaeocystis_antarctica.AAC.3